MARKSQDFKLVKGGEIRVRVAPSPTGYFHVATARAALFNYLFAKQNQGVFVLRIEDTDKERSKPEYEKDIIENFKWLGLDWNEGPYYQSQRTAIYRKYLEKLLAEDKAYYCFCSKEDLEAQSQYLMSMGKAPIYSGHCRDLDKGTIEKNLKEGKEAIIRFKTPIKKLVFKDLVRGEIEFDTGLIGDFSLAKNFDEPLYNFSCAVDDFEMKISHVLRGEDHVSNTPKQILIQETLGFPTPIYGHLPMILAADRTKLSKRHGSTSVRDFKEDGYLPEALINFIAFLGWNPGNDREIYSLPNLVKEFSLERVRKSGAIFNQKRLDFINGFYIRLKPLEKLTEECLPYLEKAGLVKKGEEQEPEFAAEKPTITALETNEEVTFEKLMAIIALYRERLKKLSEIGDLADYFFKDRLKYEKELLFWKEQKEEGTLNNLKVAEQALSQIADEDLTKTKIEEILLEKAKASASKDRGYLLWPLRAALSGKKASAGPFEIAEVLGKEKTLKRIKEAKEKIISAQSTTI